MRTGSSWLGRFSRDRKGATAIEFAIVCLPFLVIILFILQVALVHFGRQSLDFAIGTASRAVMTGTLSSSNRTLANFRSQTICPLLLLNFDCTKVVVNAYKVSPKSDASNNTGIYQFIDTTAVALRQPSSQGSFCLGGPGDLVFLDVTYDFPNFLGSLVSSSTVTNALQLRATTFFRSEQYTGAGSTC